MKKITWLAICLGLVFIIFAATGCEGITSPPSNSTSGTVSQQNTGIWVTGIGEVDVSPDLATLQVGVQAQDTTVASAQSQASAAMSSVMTALLEGGVAQDDIQTRYFSIQENTRYDSTTNEQVVTGYTVTNTVTAKIRDLSRVSSIIDAVVRAGGNFVRINSLTFSVEDPTAYYDEARKKAMAQAAERAAKLADLADVKLAAPTYISESASSPGIISPSLAVPVPAPTATLPPVSPGQITITLTVQVAYGIR